MTQHTIKVNISKTGKTTVEVNGIKGDSCKGITEKLVNALGIPTGSEPTPEAFESESQAVDTTHIA